MPVIAITENTAAQNGAVVDTVFSGLEDTYIGEESPGFVYDGESELALGPSALEETKPMFRATGISNVPAGATINSAFLDIKSNVGFGTVNADVFALLRAWVKGQATWEAFATGSSWGTNGADGAADKAASPSNPSPVVITQNATWYRFDITSIVSNPNGYIVEGSPPGDFRNFHRQTSTDGDRPQVIIDYTEAASGPTLDSITGTLSPGATVTLTTTDFGSITTATLGGQSLTINSSAADSHSITVPSNIALLWGRTDLTLEVGDGTDTSSLTDQTLSNRTGWSAVTFSTAPNANDTESLYELAVNDLSFTADPGDQFQYQNITGLNSVNAQTIVFTDDVDITSTVAIFDVSAGTRTTELTFTVVDEIITAVESALGGLPFGIMGEFF